MDPNIVGAFFFVLDPSAARVTFRPDGRELRRGLVAGPTMMRGSAAFCQAIYYARNLSATLADGPLCDGAL